jgi:hypothetical protein
MRISNNKKMLKYVIFVRATVVLNVDLIKEFFLNKKIKIVKNKKGGKYA